MADTELKPMRRRRGPLQPRRDLRDLAAGVADLPSPLDLVHVTTVFRGTDIVRGKPAQLEPQPCPVFGRNLLYAFLARPAYRVRKHDERSEDLTRFPFVFVISPAQLGTPHHVYPFDTGAGAQGRYADGADNDVPLEDFALDPDLDAARRHIAWCFETNGAYLDGEVRPELRQSLGYEQMVAHTLLRIVSLASNAHDRPDRRASAIEVAFARNIPLKDNVRLVIVPEQLIEPSTKTGTDFAAALKTLGVAWETYAWRPNETPDHFMDEIERLVRKHLERTGQL